MFKIEIGSSDSFFRVQFWEEVMTEYNVKICTVYKFFALANYFM